MSGSKLLFTPLLIGIFIVSIQLPAFAGGPCENLLLQHFDRPEPLGALQKKIFDRLSRKMTKRLSTDPVENRRMLTENRLLLRLLENPDSPAQRWVRRELLARDLDAMAAALDLKPAETRRARFHRLLRNPALAFIWNPLTLPTITDKAIPESLMEKIMTDGIAAHQEEIDEAFNDSHQSRVESYRELTRVYQAAALALFAWLTWSQIDGIKETINQAQVEQLDKDLSSMEDLLLEIQKEIERRSSAKNLR